MKIRLIVIISILTIGACMIGLPVSITQASDEKIHFPVVETLDLYVDGSNTPQIINISSDFDTINRIIFLFIWTDNDIDFDVFGTHDAPLTNGTLIHYNNTQIFNSISCIHCFSTFTYDSQIYSDEKTPIENHLTARLSFFKFIEGGLDVRFYQLQFIVRDNIPAYCSTFSVQIHGEKTIYTLDIKTPSPNILTDIQEFAVQFMSHPLWWVVLLIPLAFIIMIIKR